MILDSLGGEYDWGVEIASKTTSSMKIINIIKKIRVISFTEFIICIDKNLVKVL